MYNLFFVGLLIYLVKVLIGLYLRKVCLQLSGNSIIRNRAIKPDILFNRNWGINDISGSLKDSNLLLKAFYFFILSSLSINKGAEFGYLTDQLLELLRVYFRVITITVISIIQFLLEVTLGVIVSESRYYKGFVCNIA